MSTINLRFCLDSEIKETGKETHQGGKKRQLSFESLKHKNRHTKKGAIT